MQKVKTIVWIKGSTPTPAEQAVIDKLGSCSLLNASFFSPKPSEYVQCSQCYNLSKNSDIDSVYADVLIKEKVIIDPVIAELETAPADQEMQDVPEVLSGSRKYKSRVG